MGKRKYFGDGKKHIGFINKTNPKITIAIDIKIPLLSDKVAITTNKADTPILNIPN